LTAVFLVGAAACRGQGVTPNGGEFSILGAPHGDQVLPSIALTPAGSVLAFFHQGMGVHAALLDAGYAAHSFSSVHKTAVADQVKPAIVPLRNGSSFNGNNLYVWQSKVLGLPSIYARLARGTNFPAQEIRVNNSMADQRVNPAASATLDGGAMVAWASYLQDGGQWGIYARKVTASGALAGAQEFRVNQFIGNQREPAVCTLAKGYVVFAWVSDAQRSAVCRDVYARVFTTAGIPVTGEILVNTLSNKCASPALAPLNNGGFTVAWSQKDTVLTNGWDVWGRAFSDDGAPSVKPFRINSYLYGDQYQPRLASGPTGVLAVWTSLGQDGDREGVYGRFLLGGNQVSGDEFRVNTTTVSQQLDPDVAWDGANHFLVVWTSFTGVTGSPGSGFGFGLYGQRYTLSR
jgi:hypothetical protein